VLSGRHGSEVTEIPVQVPQEPNSFVGRECELTELCELLGVTRALTLCGPGGIGKTRLAQQILHKVAAAFPDGGCFVDLGDVW
jgi:MoxR-like ATPase